MHSLHARQPRHLSFVLPFSLHQPSVPNLNPACLSAPRLTPSLQTYSLRDNYRSSERIVRTAHALISSNLDWQRAGLQPLLGLGQHIEVRGSRPPLDGCSLTSLLARFLASLLDWSRRHLFGWVHAIPRPVAAHEQADWHLKACPCRSGNFLTFMRRLRTMPIPFRSCSCVSRCRQKRWRCCAAGSCSSSTWRRSWWVLPGGGGLLAVHCVQGLAHKVVCQRQNRRT